MSSGLPKVLVFGLALMLTLGASSSHALKTDKGNELATQHGNSKEPVSIEKMTSELQRRGCHVLKAKRQMTANGDTVFAFKCLMRGGKIRTMVLNPDG